MKNKYIFVLVMLLGILLVSGGLTTVYVNNNQDNPVEDKLTVVTSFYPMYIAALNVVGDNEDVILENLSEPQTGCLHDFQLTPEDMKLLSRADVFIVNGGGIESFMEEVAKAYPDLQIVEACQGIELLADEEEENAHAWMSVELYRKQVENIASAMAKADPASAEDYANNARSYDLKLENLQSQIDELKEVASNMDSDNVILFHEAYDYVAASLGLNPVFLMDLDEERQISAGEVAQVVGQIRDNGVKYILAEELYGRSMGDTVEKETEAVVIYIDPLNRGDYDPDSYIDGMQKNIDLLASAFGKE